MCSRPSIKRTGLHELHNKRPEAGIPGARPIVISIMVCEKNLEFDTISKTNVNWLPTVVMLALPLAPSTDKVRGAIEEMCGYGSSIPVEYFSDEKWTFGESITDNCK